MDPIPTHIEFYAGYKADERPVSFTLNSGKLIVERIIDQWRTPDAEYFKLIADDGKGYLLRNDTEGEGWFIEKVSAV